MVIIFFLYSQLLHRGRYRKTKKVSHIIFCLEPIALFYGHLALLIDVK